MQPDHFKFTEISYDQIIKKARTTKANMGGCATAMPGKLYKKSIEILADVIAMLFTQCLLEGVYPTEFKSAVITPLHKKGDRRDANNYRPISSVPYLAKLLESLVNDQINTYLENLEFTHPYQFGFRKRSNTCLALTQLQKYITEQWEQKKMVVAIFLDVEKAFD